ncbi:MAG: M48 family metalloprotease [Candidatus Gastranaerophilales bacterium]|nr:M48 family metalloprotease [Candidatus Gastranaerophilales bacterium]
MKKILSVFFVMALITLQACAAQWSANARVQVVGRQLLAKNNISSKVLFKVVDGTADNSGSVSAMIVYISSTNLSYASDDNEVAAVIADELGHIICNHYSKSTWKSLAISSLSDKLGSDNSLVEAATSTYSGTKFSQDEIYDADIMGADLMVKSGFNPLAMVSWITKLPGSTLDVLKSKPSNADRAMNVYNFLIYTYPDIVRDGYDTPEYKKFLAYAAPIVKERNSDKKKLAKFNAEQKNAEKTRQQNFAKYNTSGSLSNWGNIYELLINK